MKKIGIIGYGSMGSMLLTRFLRVGAVNPEQVIVSTLIGSGDNGLSQLKQEYPGLEIAHDNQQLAQQCGIALVCVKPLEVKGVLEEIKDVLLPGVHLVSIAASVTLRHMETFFKGKITRVVPSITFKVDTGISLVCHNLEVEPGDAEYIERLFSAISTVKVIDEEEIEVATNLTSTAPGLIAAIFREFVESGLKYSHFTREEVEEMVITTFYGISRLFYQRLMKFPDTVSRVATKGGITEVGNEVIQKNLPLFFDELFARTLGKFEEIKEEVSHQFLESMMKEK